MVLKMAKNNNSTKEINIEEYNKKNIKYWEEVEKKKLKKQTKNIDKIQKELKTQYIKAQKEINAKISDLYMRYMEQNELSFSEASKLLSSGEYKEWKKDLSQYIKLIEETGDPQLLLELNTLAMKSRISRLEEMFYQIDKQINSMYTDYNSNVEIFLKDSVKDSYYQSIYSVQKYFGQGSAFGLLDDDLIQTVISYPWSGRNFSGVIWENRDKLKRTVKNEITQMVIQGKSSKDVAKNIANKLNTDFKHAIRVVNTEHSYIMSEASAKAYEETGVEYYQFISTLDNKTSEVCQRIDLKIFKLEDRTVGVNASPMHPNCRSTEVPYFEDEEGETRIARGLDGKTYQVPSNMNYEEWYNKHVGPKTTDGVKIKFNDVDKKDIKKPKPIVKKKKSKSAKEKVEEQKETKLPKEKVTKPKKTNKDVSKDTSNKVKVEETKVTEPKSTKQKLPKFKKPSAYKRFWGAELEEMHKEWENSLTDSAKESIRKYTHQEWYATINQKLRNPEYGVNENLQTIFDDITGALAKNKLPKSMQVYRGSDASIFKSIIDDDLYKQMRTNKANIDDLKEKLVGTIIKDNAFMSTTVNPDMIMAKSTGFLKNVFFKIDIDKNVNGAAYIANLSAVPFETEVLLDKGTKLYIKDMSWNEDLEAYEILCHYIGQ